MLDALPRPHPGAPLRMADPLQSASAPMGRLCLQLQDALAAERQAIARDLHDQIGAGLTGMRLQLEVLASRVQGGSPVSPAELLALAHTARDTQLATRDICSRLRPQLLEDLGLMEACRWYLRDWSAQVGIAAKARFARCKAEPDAELATALFRVMQELLTNVARHSGAARVRVSLSAGAAELRLRVQDDGHGFAPEQQPPGLGLLGLRERVRDHGGAFDLHSGAGGTTVTVRMKQLVPA